MNHVMYECRWSTSAGIWELRGKNLPWLREACRERGLATARKNRQELIQQLLDWQKEQGQ